jgi:hypothetical protein
MSVISKQLKNHLFLLGAFTLAFNLALFALGWPLDTLDARFSYSPKEVGALFWRLGEEGRARYLLVTRLDSAFIVVYSFFLTLLARSLARGWWRWLATGLVALTALFDLLETGGIRYLLELFPAADDRTAAFVAGCTPLKWIALCATGITLGLMGWRKAKSE